MAPDLTDQLERLAVDCWEATGSPFRHFLCPILLIDEQTALCRAHVVNRAFNDAPGTWTVQRQDVDNFFGSAVEAAFTALQDARAGAQFEQVTDPRKRRRLRTAIRLDGRPVDYFLPSGPVPDQYTLVSFDDGAKRVPLAIKMSEPELAASMHGNWRIELDFDVRYPALVSLIKAAFLTKFIFFGYRYALSPAGKSVGADLLGTFFVQCRDLKRAAVADRIPGFFGDVQAMVRPVVSNPLGYKGTTVDGRMLLCWEEHGIPWATIVFVPGAGMHSVIMPLQEDGGALDRYQRFLASDEEDVAVREAVFHRRDRCWQVSPTARAITWPRTRAA